MQVLTGYVKRMKGFPLTECVWTSQKGVLLAGNECRICGRGYTTIV